MILALAVWHQWPDEKLHVVFCDVGQGDAILVIKNNFQVLVDTGQKADLLGECLSDHLPFWDRTLEAMYISHTDKDHNSLVSQIQKQFKVERLFLDSIKGDVLRYQSLQIETLAGAEPNDGGRVLGTNTDNESSVVLRVVMGEFSVLLTGDLDEKAELALMEMGVLEKSTVLKVGHHGSKSSSGQKFLETLKPDLAIVSVGEKNTYGHPSRKALIRLESVGSKVLRTDDLGTIEVVSDGVGVRVLTRKK